VRKDRFPVETHFDRRDMLLRDIIKRMRRDGCGGRELLTGMKDQPVAIWMVMTLILLLLGYGMYDQMPLVTPDCVPITGSHAPAYQDCAVFRRSLSALMLWPNTHTENYRVCYRRDRILHCRPIDCDTAFVGCYCRGAARL
jgi:hypothetical protein